MTLLLRLTSLVMVHKMYDDVLNAVGVHKRSPWVAHHIYTYRYVCAYRIYTCTRAYTHNKNLVEIVSG